MTNILSFGTLTTSPAALPSTLRSTYWELLSAVGDYLGVGTSPSGDELVIVRDAVRRGYRRFLNPPSFVNKTGLGEEYPHVWSWLSPLATLNLVTAQYLYTLPADFAQLIGTFSYALATGTGREIVHTEEGRIRHLRAAQDVSGDPYFCALRPKSSGLSYGQLHEVLFYPTPSQDRELRYRYAVDQQKLDTAKVIGTDGVVSNGIAGTPNTLTSATADFSSVVAGDILIVSNGTGPTNGIYVIASVSLVSASPSASPSPSPSPSASPAATQALVVVGDMGDIGTCPFEVLPYAIFPLGALEGVEALTECCLWVAEETQDDTQGIHRAAAIDLLSDAIKRDRLRGPRTLGLLYDDSDCVAVPWTRDSLTYNGIPV
jgi:hypothetical protein